MSAQVQRSLPAVRVIFLEATVVDGITVVKQLSDQGKQAVRFSTPVVTPIRA